MPSKICILAHDHASLDDSFHKICNAGATICGMAPAMHMQFDNMSRGIHIPACHVFDLALDLTYQTRFVLLCKDVLVDGPIP